MVLRWLSTGSLCATLLVCPALAPAEEPAVDADFLEFLGSLDSDDSAWADLLAAAAARKDEGAEAAQEPQPKKVDP